MSNSLSSIFKVTNFSKLLRIAGVLVLCGHATAVSAADSDSPADIFGKLPPAADIKLSPDGTKAVILRAMGDTYGVILMVRKIQGATFNGTRSR